MWLGYYHNKTKVKSLKVFNIRGGLLIIKSLDKVRYHNIWIMIVIRIYRYQNNFLNPSEINPLE